VRNPLEVATSLLGRDGIAPLVCVRLWLRHHRDLLDMVPPEQRIVTHYESYFIDGPAETRRVAEFLGLATDEETIQTACATVAAKLRHSRFGAGDLERVSAPAEVTELYRRLIAEAGPVFARGPQSVG